MPLPNDMRAAVPEAGLLPNDPQAVFLKERVVAQLHAIGVVRARVAT